MQGVLNATDVRRDWSAFVDQVVRSKPSFVRRNRDCLAALSLEHLQLILSAYRFDMEYEQEEDGMYSGSIRQIDVVGNADSINALKRVLAQDLVGYAQDYMDDFDVYYHSTNRRNHLPYVLAILAQHDISGVEILIDA